MSRCLLVATDGAPAAQSALRYAISFAARMGTSEIACLCVREPEYSHEPSFIALPAPEEPAVANGCGGNKLRHNRKAPPRPAVDPDAVLDECSRTVRAAGLRFTPIIGKHAPRDVMEQTSHIGELVFIGRNSERSAAASGRVGFTASTALQVVRQTLLVCPPEYRSIERLLIALSADLEEDARLTALAGTWAALFDVPVRISVIGRGRKYAAQCLDAARRTLDACRLELVSEGNFTRPEDFADELPPSDLLLVGRNRRPVVEQLALQVACPIAALARPDS